MKLFFCLKQNFLFYALFLFFINSNAQWKYYNANEIPDAVIINYDVIYERELTTKEKASNSFLKEIQVAFTKDKLLVQHFHNSPESLHSYRLFDYNKEKYYSCHNCKKQKTATEYPFKTPSIKATLQPNATKKIFDFNCEKSVVLIKGKHKEIFHTKEIGLRFVKGFDIEGFVLEYPGYNNSLGHYKVVAREIKNYVLDASYFSLDGLTIRTKTEYNQQKEAKLEKIEAANKEKIGTVFPKFTKRTLSGKKISYKDFKKHVTVINFWYSTCPPCKKEIPQLNKLKNMYKNEKVNFFAFSLDDDTKLNKFIKDNPFYYDQVTSARDFARSMGIRYYPTNIVLDNKGKIQFYKTGYKSDIVKQLSEKIDELLD